VLQVAELPRDLVGVVAILTDPRGRCCLLPRTNVPAAYNRLRSSPTPSASAACGQSIARSRPLVAIVTGPEGSVLPQGWSAGPWGSRVVLRSYRPERVGAATTMNNHSPSVPSRLRSSPVPKGRCCSPQM
jgi:hypothetical protein